MNPCFDIGCFGFAAQVSSKKWRRKTCCTTLGMNEDVRVSKNSFHILPTPADLSPYAMLNKAVGHIIVLYHLFLRIMGASTAVISACFSYLSDYCLLYTSDAADE